MSNRPTLFVFIGTIMAMIMSAMATPALAQLSAKGGAVSIDSESLEAIDERREAVFTGKVDATQDDVRLRADKLTVLFDAETADAGSSNPVGNGWGDINTITAVGNVYYVTPKQVAKADKAVYDVAKDQVVMTGNVVVTQEQNVIRGEKLVLEISTGRAIFDNQTQSTEKPGRVRAVFFPREKTEDTAEPAPTSDEVSGDETGE